MSTMLDFLKVATFINGAIRFGAEVEMQMNAAERVKEYSGLSNETYEGLLYVCLLYLNSCPVSFAEFISKNELNRSTSFDILPGCAPKQWKMTM